MSRRVSKEPKTGTREATKQATRDALIAAGMALFAEQGLDGPSLDAICDHAGFTRGAFYVHFADREDFLVAVMDRVGVAYLDAVVTAGEGAQSLEITAQRFVESVWSGKYPLMPGGGIRPYQLFDACARSPRVRARYVTLVLASIDRVVGALHAGQKGGSTRTDVAAEAVAPVLLAVIIGAPDDDRPGRALRHRRLDSGALATPRAHGARPRAFRATSRATLEALEAGEAAMTES